MVSIRKMSGHKISHRTHPRRTQVVGHESRGAETYMYTPNQCPTSSGAPGATIRLSPHPSNLSSAARTKIPIPQHALGRPNDQGSQEKLSGGVGEIDVGSESSQGSALLPLRDRSGVRNFISPVQSRHFRLGVFLTPRNPRTLHSGHIYAMVVDLAPVAEPSWS